MSLVLDLSAELETELASEAAQLGIPLSEYALRLIAVARETRPALQNGAELLAYWKGEGLVGTRHEIADSQAQARALRQQAERRPRSYPMDLLDTDVLIDVQRGHPPAMSTEIF
jgi:hypothetical protein